MTAMPRTASPITRHPTAHPFVEPATPTALAAGFGMSVFSSGHPHFGQDVAWFETGFPHSMQGESAIA